MIKLENEFLSIILTEKGAELQSIFLKKNSLEFLWDGDAKYWGKHSPVLFPIVGSLKDGKYFFEEKEYHLPRHGFAREMAFEVEKNTTDEAIFLLKQNEETLKIYPFYFEFRLHYSLIGQKVSVEYAVKNTGENDMYFSVGGHPAFALPFMENTKYEDYYLQFNSSELLQRWRLKDGLVEDHPEAIEMENGRLNLSAKLFYEDAIVLKNIKSNTVSLLSNLHKHGLHFNFEGFPFFGIWAAKDAPFICLEPWCGVADNVQASGEIKNKEGIIALASNSSWQKVWSVEVF